MKNKLITDITKSDFVKALTISNGEIFFVGGCVRDLFLNKKSKDIDILIRRLSIDTITEILSNFGKIDAVGASFGVLKFIPTGMELDEPIDIALPRVETNTGSKHTDFNVLSDPDIPLEKDLFRRDFTCNSIAMDLLGNFIDPFNGIEDIKNKQLKLTNKDAFSDDPLRMLRAIQFSSRFDFDIEKNTLEQIKSNRKSIEEISGERITIELDKIFFKGNIKKGFDLLEECGFNFGFVDVTLIEKIKTRADFFGVLTNFDTDLFTNRLKGDLETTKEMKSIAKMKFIPAGILNLVLCRITVTQEFKKTPNVFKSGIILNVFKQQFELLKTDPDLPLNIGEISVNGNDLMAIGLKGKDI